MSDTVETTEVKTPRRRWGRIAAWIFGGLFALLLVVCLGGWYYTTTADFQRRVGAEVVSVLEDSTGGRVELGHISFSLLHLAIEADGLVIHGTEGRGEAPYISVAKIFIRLKIHTFLSHTVGKGAQSHIGLNFLRAEEPHVHLIVAKDGTTNQPVPKRKSSSTEPIQDSLLDLQVGKIELADGIIALNNRAIPFDLTANNLQAEVHYIAADDHYGATIVMDDLQTKMADEPEVQSKLRLTAEVGRDTAELKSFDFTTGKSTHLTATALVNHFAKPEWQASIDGAMELKQLGYLAGVEGLTAGTLDLNVRGRNCEVGPVVAQKKQGFFARRRAKSHPPPPDASKMLPPDPECKAGYLAVGVMKMRNVGYVNQNVRLHDVNGGAQLHITPTELLFTALTGTLPGGGEADGVLRISNWLGEVDAAAPTASATAVAAAKTANNVAKSAGAKPVVKDLRLTPVGAANAHLTVTVKAIPLRTILDIAAPPNFGDLGLDTAITGPVKVDWGGPAADIADTVQVDANLQMAPTGVARAGARSNVPVHGQILAKYDGGSEVVRIDRVTVLTPATALNVSGVLGVNKGDPLTALRVDLQARDIGEFDQLLTTLDLTSGGKKGSAAVPVVLHGTLAFNGTASGPILDMDVKGHLVADNVEVKLGTGTDTLIDSIVADAEYSPSTGVAVASSTIKRQTAVLNLTGTVHPRRVAGKRGAVAYVWDKGIGIDANVKLVNAQVTDLLEIAGQQNKVPVTGTANITAHVSGTIENMNGGGNVTLTNGVAYGEGYQTIAVDATVLGQQIDASRVLVAAHGMQVTGNGSYNVASKHIRAHIEGKNIQLSKLDLVQQQNIDADASVTLNADADGTLDEPNLHAKVSLMNVVVQGKPLGELTATAYSTGSTVFYDAHSTLVGARVDANGQTSLKGNFDTQTKVTIAGLDIAKPMALFSQSNIQGTSAIGGTITVSGPAATPKALTGTAVFDQFDVKLVGVELKTAEPLRASLRDGVVTVDQLHITGQDTDLHVGGTAKVFGDTNPNGGALNLHANGNVSMALAHTFDPDLIASGKVTFKMAVDGRMKTPQLRGDVQFVHVNVALDGVPNGLTDLNGSLVFNQNRLDVKDLVGTTGGGKLRIGGALSYQQKGIYADLTATGDVVRVRLYGLSATANAQFRLQGGPQSALLSGNVLVTRFGIGADVDFAAFAGSGGVSAPSDPNSPANKIQLDVHVTSAPQLDFQNSYAKLAGTVDLTVRGTMAVPAVLGKILITDGSATFAGTKYELQRGSIYFTNPVRIDPVIDLDATARVSNYDLTIGLHGTITSLKPTYRSEPPLTEADIFNLLALGRTQEEAQIYQEQQVQAGSDPTTSALLGGALNATVSNRVGKLFGAGSVKIDPSFVGTLGNSTARITVSEPLSKQLTLVFATNVNQSAEQLIQVQYQMTENTQLVATRDETGVFSVVYRIRKRYR
ncbi:MAG TPA: translocation/assembly module TamB domain-containing protein [Acidobacteriaceae bacterium]|nr:translocation/assembly module TamB domain-containing protein [Acidobacteriaceae bacterium]